MICLKIKTSRTTLGIYQSGLELRLACPPEAMAGLLARVLDVFDVDVVVVQPPAADAEQLPSVTVTHTPAQADKTPPIALKPRDKPVKKPGIVRENKATGKRTVKRDVTPPKKMAPRIPAMKLDPPELVCVGVAEAVRRLAARTPGLGWLGVNEIADMLDDWKKRPEKLKNEKEVLRQVLIRQVAAGEWSEKKGRGRTKVYRPGGGRTR